MRLSGRSTLRGSGTRPRRRMSLRLPTSCPDLRPSASANRLLRHATENVAAARARPRRDRGRQRCCRRRAGKGPSALEANQRGFAPSTRTIPGTTAANLSTNPVVHNRNVTACDHRLPRRREWIFNGSSRKGGSRSADRVNRVHGHCRAELEASCLDRRRGRARRPFCGLPGDRRAGRGRGHRERGRVRGGGGRHAVRARALGRAGLPDLLGRRAATHRDRPRRRGLPARRARRLVRPRDGLAVRRADADHRARRVRPGGAGAGHAALLPAAARGPAGAAGARSSAPRMPRDSPAPRRTPAPQPPRPRPIRRRSTPAARWW